MRANHLGASLVADSMRALVHLDGRNIPPVSLAEIRVFHKVKSENREH